MKGIRNRARAIGKQPDVTPRSARNYCVRNGAMAPGQYLYFEMYDLPITEAALTG